MYLSDFVFCISHPLVVRVIMKFQWRGGLPYISWCARKDGWDARWRRGEGADHSGHDGDADYDHKCYNFNPILPSLFEHIQEPSPPRYLLVWWGLGSNSFWQ